MYNQDYDGQDPNTLPDPVPTPPTQAGPNGGNATLLGYDGQTEVYQGSDGQKYVVGPNGANGLGTWVPYTGKATTFSPNPTHGDPVVEPPPPTPGPAPAPAPAPGASAFPSGQAPPTFTPPPIAKPEPWNYAAFVAPDPSEVNSDPWTQYQLKTEADQVQRSAAARGVLNTGGTINQLLTGANDITNAGYGNIFARAAQTYGMNRQNSLDSYNSRYQTQFQDPEKWSYQGAQDLYNSQQHNFDNLNNYSWARTLFGEQQANDAFDKRFRIYDSLGR